MRSSRSDGPAAAGRGAPPELPDVLALPVAEALALLAEAGVAARVVETTPPGPAPGGEPRVLAVRAGPDGVTLIAARPGVVPG